MQSLSRGSRVHRLSIGEAGESPGRRRFVSSGSQATPVQTRPGWHAFFAEAVRLVLAPFILLFSGFFTANFFISGQFTWPRTSRVFALTLTVIILAFEFVYKERLSRTGSPDRARTAVLYSCVVPYLLGILLMFALWKM